jgi:hypothetical protein
MACLDSPAQRFPRNPSLRTAHDTLKLASQIGIMNSGQLSITFPALCAEHRPDTARLGRDEPHVCSGDRLANSWASLSAYETAGA